MADVDSVTPTKQERELIVSEFVDLVFQQMKDPVKFYLIIKLLQEYRELLLMELETVPLPI